jgi:hypothetical protein
MDRRDVHENPSANQVILVNISHLKGKVAKMVLLVQDRIKPMVLKKRKALWINDSCG